MTTPYRIVWHSYDPHNAHDTIGPGCRNGWITVQELLQRPGRTYYRTHIVRVLYAEWQAEIYCRYDETLDTLSHTAIRRASQALCEAVANRAELEQTIFRNMDPEQFQDRQIQEQHTNNGPIDLRLVDNRDDEGHRFIAFSVLCTSIGHGPFMVKVVGKRWDVAMTEDEEGLTESERNRLEITDEDWYMNNPRFPQGAP